MVGCTTGRKCHHITFELRLLIVSHSNVDRLLAMWQDLYDTKYAQWLKSPPANEGDNPKSWLAPFHTNSSGDEYDSIECSYQQKTLGYTYPELQKWLPVYKTDGQFDPEKFKRMLRANIELRYSTTGKSTLQLSKNHDIATAHMAAMTKENLEVENFPPPVAEKASVRTRHRDGDQAGLGTPPRVSWEDDDYVVNVVYDR